MRDNPEVADRLEAAIRENSQKLMRNPARTAATAAAAATQGVDVSAEDFADAD
jgi:recombination protein RecA